MCDETKDGFQNHFFVPLIYTTLTIAVFAVYWQVNQFDFIAYDDPVYVSQNTHLPSGFTMDGLRWAFSTKYFGLWNPLVWLSLMLDYRLFGLNAGGYHLTNLLFHILSTLLLFRLFNRMTGEIWKSAFVAAFFALHPLHVESVAWIAERKDVLSAFFWILTLCFYVDYTKKPAVARYLTVLLCFVCALMSKPMVVTLPAIMILLDYWPLNRFESHKDKRILWQLKEKSPLFLLSAMVIIITLYHSHPSSFQYISSFPLNFRIANAPVSFVFYLCETFWPLNLAVFYPFPDQLQLWQILISVFFILMVSTFVIIMMKPLPYLFTGWLWYLITLFPVIGIIQIGPHLTADRYTYLPLIGIAAVLAWGFPFLFTSKIMHKVIIFPSGVTILLILTILMWRQCGYWKNNTSLFNHTLQVTTNNFMAHNNYGVILFNEGKTGEAIDHYSEVILTKPDFSLPYYNRGIAYSKLGQYKLAIHDFNHAIDLKHDDADAYDNRANAYFNLGNKELGCSDAQQACRLGICKTWEWSKKIKHCR